MKEKPKSGTTEYNWCQSQRTAYKKGKLSKEQVQKLQEIEWWFWSR